MDSNPSCRQYYLDIRLDFFDELEDTKIEIDEAKFKFAIFSALKVLHGEMGCIIPVDILKYRKEDRRAFIRIPSKEITKVWTALTLFSSYEGVDCLFSVYKVSPLLACLNLNSRIYNHKVKVKCEA